MSALTPLSIPTIVIGGPGESRSGKCSAGQRAALQLARRSRPVDYKDDAWWKWGTDDLRNSQGKKTVVPNHSFNTVSQQAVI